MFGLFISSLTCALDGSVKLPQLTDLDKMDKLVWTLSDAKHIQMLHQHLAFIFDSKKVRDVRISSTRPIPATVSSSEASQNRNIAKTRIRCKHCRAGECDWEGVASVPGVVSVLQSRWQGRPGYSTLQLGAASPRGVNLHLFGLLTPLMKGWNNVTISFDMRFSVLSTLDWFHSVYAILWGTLKYRLYCSVPFNLVVLYARLF